MKKLVVSLSLLLSLGLATISPTLNAAQAKISDAARATMRTNPSGWAAAKKWWKSGRNMNALNPQEQRAFNTLKRNIGIGAIVTAIAALIAGGTAYQHNQNKPTPVSGNLRDLRRPVPTVLDHGREVDMESLIDEISEGWSNANSGGLNKPTIKGILVDITKLVPYDNTGFNAVDIIKWAKEDVFKENMSPVEFFDAIKYAKQVRLDNEQLHNALGSFSWGHTSPSGIKRPLKEVIDREATRDSSVY